MVTPEYCRLMARASAVQNRRMLTRLSALPGAAQRELLPVLDDFLQGDLLRLDLLQGVAPGGPVAAPTLATWGAERFKADARLLAWAQGLGRLALLGTLDWPEKPEPGAALRPQPVGLAVAELFLRQAELRGRIAVLAAQAGAEAWPTGLAVLTET